LLDAPSTGAFCLISTQPWAKARDGQPVMTAATAATTNDVESVRPSISVSFV
jgi:hypothetical protein